LQKKRGEGSVNTTLLDLKETKGVPEEQRGAILDQLARKEINQKEARELSKAAKKPKTKTAADAVGNGLERNYVINNADMPVAFKLDDRHSRLIISLPDKAYASRLPGVKRLLEEYLAGLKGYQVV
jgi:uncharacterized FlaG/YvyC family protein